MLLDKPYDNGSIVSVQFAEDCPVFRSHPSVTYVSLTDKDNLIDGEAEADGHRFILLQADGLVRVLQASKGKVP